MGRAKMRKGKGVFLVGFIRGVRRQLEGIKKEEKGEERGPAGKGVCHGGAGRFKGVSMVKASNGGAKRSVRLLNDYIYGERDTLGRKLKCNG